MCLLCLGRLLDVLKSEGVCWVSFVCSVLRIGGCIQRNLVDLEQELAVPLAQEAGKAAVAHL